MLVLEYSLTTFTDRTGHHFEYDKISILISISAKGCCFLILYYYSVIFITKRSIFYRLKHGESSSGYSSGTGLSSSSPSAASSYLSVPSSSSRFSSGTNSPLHLNVGNRNASDNCSNVTPSYSTLSPSGTISPTSSTSSRYEMSATVPNYHR